MHLVSAKRSFFVKSLPLIFRYNKLCLNKSCVRYMNEKLFLVCALLLVGISASAMNHPLLEKYCFDCHDSETQKGDVRLDNLNSLKLQDRLDMLNRAQEQIYIGEMPPRKKKKQPSEDQRQEMIDIITVALKKHNASKLEEKLRRPEFGNYVKHEKLFSGQYTDLSAFTPDRRWLISEFIFNERINRIIDLKSTKTIDKKRQSVFGSSKRKVNITNPFLLPTNTGVRYYANETLNGGHLLTMITNAKELADYMSYQSKRNRNYIPAVTKIMELENSHNATLEKRAKFLEVHIEGILRQIYGKEHEELLPKFEPVIIPPPAKSKDGKAVKKAAFHAANPGRYEMPYIYKGLKLYLKEGLTEEEAIVRCEKDWFYAGHSSRKIQARVTFMKGYMADIKKHMNSGHNKRVQPDIYKPLNESELKVYQSAIQKHRRQGDRYNQIIDRCLAQWEAEFKEQRIQAGPPDVITVKDLVDQLFVKIFERHPNPEELSKYSKLTSSYIQELGNLAAIEKLIQTLILRSEFVYRYEFGSSGEDQHGRRMMSPRDASYALAYALTDSSPDKELLKAVEEGRLNTREDYRREVERMLKNRSQYYVIDEAVDSNDVPSITNLPVRKLRFFREFFGYPKMLTIFKDNIRFGSNYDRVKTRLVAEADMLVEHILKKDKNVFEDLLTTEEFYVYHSGDNEAVKEASDRIRRIYDYFKDKGWENFKSAEDLAPHADFINEVKMRGIDTKRLKKDRRYNPLRAFQTAMKSFTQRLSKGQKAAAPYPSFPAHGFSNAYTRTGGRLSGPEVGKFFNVDFGNWDYPTTQPTKIPHRKGMLTHPAWLIAHAQNTETDPVIRGKWVREKLLAGTLPDVPITVEAVVPEDHHKTLRMRHQDVTEKPECWKCHERMNPLGYAFEIYDDFGVYRTEESIEHPENLIKKAKEKQPIEVDGRAVYKTLPVNSKSYLDGTGDPKLDGDVDDAIDMAGRLSKSVRVRQSIIRHAFRYFMGRNEALSDSKTLIDADNAYVKSGGSFDAVIISLLSSDSFIYRKAVKE